MTNSVRKVLEEPPILNEQDIANMRHVGKLAAMVLEMIGEHIHPGVSTDELDQKCHTFMTEELDCTPAPLNYTNSESQPPFPKSTCTSVNNVVCHGIPSNSKVLRKGDILNIDVTLIKNGFHGDTSKMFFVGEPSVLARRLVEITQECMYRGIDTVRPGSTLGDIGYAIQKFAESNRFSVVREFCGHGIGKIFHDAPQVLHYGEPNTGLVLKEGMAFTIEPMINAGKRFVRILPDRWTVVTRDRKLSAQWEHTILVTESGREILTLRDEESHPRVA